MLMWLLVLLLLFILVYVVYRLNLSSPTKNERHEDEQHYTFKL